VRPDGLDVAGEAIALVVEDRVQGLVALDFDLAVCPAGDFDDEVDYLFVGFVGVEGDVVPEGDGGAVLFEPDAPFLDILSIGWGLGKTQLGGRYQSVAATNGPQAEGVIVEARGGRKGRQNSEDEALAEHVEQ
jgi:hypothetical protein